MMNILHKILDKLSSQIKGSNVKLPKSVEDSPKIQDNNQAINNGAINEKSTSNLRSTSPTRSVGRRSPKSHRKD